MIIHNKSFFFPLSLSFHHVFLIQEIYDEYTAHNEMNMNMNMNMNEYSLMESKYAEDNVDDIMFRDDSNWDNAHDFVYDGTHFIRKCKSFLGINWCYCKSPNSPLPWPCFNLPKHKKHKIKVKIKADTNKDFDVKVSVKHGKKTNAIQAQYNEYNEYNYYDDLAQQIRTNNNLNGVDRAYFENDANWNSVSSSSSSFSTENNDLIHGGLTKVTRKCKQMGLLWSCFCQGLDKTIFKCNMNQYQIGIYYLEI